MDSNNSEKHSDYALLASQKSHGGHPHAEEGEGPWLMSFADMVTLLMCFFILFFSVDKGNIEVDDPIKLRSLLAKLEKIADVEVKDSKEPINLKSQPSSVSEEIDIEELKKLLEKISVALDVVLTVEQPEPGRVELTFLNLNFFKPGQAILTLRAQKMIEVAAKKLSKLPPLTTVEIHGHTDSDPIKSRIFPSNWELSSARAAAVLKVLANSGVKPERMRSVGFAHYQPVAPEFSENGWPNPSNKSLNRRIVIVVNIPELKYQKGNKRESDANSIKDTRIDEPKRNILPTEKANPLQETK